MNNAIIGIATLLEIANLMTDEHVAPVASFTDAERAMQAVAHYNATSLLYQVVTYDHVSYWLVPVSVVKQLKQAGFQAMALPR